MVKSLRDKRISRHEMFVMKSHRVRGTICPRRNELRAEEWSKDARKPLPLLEERVEVRASLYSHSIVAIMPAPSVAACRCNGAWLSGRRFACPSARDKNSRAFPARG